MKDSFTKEISLTDNQQTFCFSQKYILKTYLFEHALSTLIPMSMQIKSFFIIIPDNSFQTDRTWLFFTIYLNEEGEIFHNLRNI